MASRIKSFATIAVILLFSAASASAVQLSFDQLIISGSLDHVAGGTVTGTGIGFETLTVDGAGAFDQTILCAGCELNFTSGALTTEGPTSWEWSAGGSWSIEGTLLAVNGVLGNDITGVLASGSFDGGAFAQSFGSRVTVLGFGFDEKNADLLTELDIPLATQWAFAGSAVDVDATVGMDGSFSGNVNNADWDNISVPIPGTSLLMLLGLTGLAARRRS